MATTRFEEVLQDVHRLTPEEQRRLVELIAAQLPTTQAVETPDSMVDVAASDDKDAIADAYLAQLDRLAARIGASWQGDVSAVDAVKEQRRDL